MEDQTRKLLRLLGDDLIDDLIEALSAGEVLETELQRDRSESRQTITRRLGELEVWGLVVSRDRNPPGRGRPTKGWRLADDWAVRFGDAADSAVLDLLEARAERQRKGIRERTRGRTRIVEPSRRGTAG